MVKAGLATGMISSSQGSITSSMSMQQMPVEPYIEFSQSSTDFYGAQQQQQYRPGATAILAATGGMLLNTEEMDYLERFLCSIAPAEMTKGLPQTPPPAQEPAPPAPTTATARTTQKVLRAKTALMPILVRPPGHAFSGQVPINASPVVPYLDSRKNDADTKRAHHIASEHTRRFRIRTELMRLNDLVPGLVPSNQQSTAATSGKNSQSKILQAAADYLEKVVQENARLKAEMEVLKSQNTEQ